MTQGRTLIIAFVALVIGFAGGFVLRPIIAPAPSIVTADPTSAEGRSAPSGPRGTQYFVAHIDEARQVVTGCRDGSVRGGECGTAEEAIIKVDAAERRKRFLGN